MNHSHDVTFAYENLSEESRAARRVEQVAVVKDQLNKDNPIQVVYDS